MTTFLHNNVNIGVIAVKFCGYLYVFSKNNCYIIIISDVNWTKIVKQYV